MNENIFIDDGEKGEMLCKHFLRNILFNLC